MTNNMSADQQYRNTCSAGQVRRRQCRCERPHEHTRPASQMVVHVFASTYWSSAWSDLYEGLSSLMPWHSTRPEYSWLRPPALEVHQHVSELNISKMSRDAGEYICTHLHPACTHCMGSSFGSSETWWRGAVTPCQESMPSEIKTKHHCPNNKCNLKNTDLTVKRAQRDTHTTV